MKTRITALKKLLFIIMAFLLLIFFVSGVFKFMNKRTKELNKETVQSIGNTYLSGITSETVDHSRTYFSGKFDVLNKVIDNAVSSESNGGDGKKIFENELTNGAMYIALLRKNGERDVIRGDETYLPLDVDAFEVAREKKGEKVLLSVNEDGDNLVEMALFREFEISGEKYSGILCGISPDTLNNILNLSYGEKWYTHLSSELLTAATLSAMKMPSIIHISTA